MVDFFFQTAKKVPWLARNQRDEIKQIRMNEFGLFFFNPLYLFLLPSEQCDDRLQRGTLFGPDCTGFYLVLPSFFFSLALPYLLFGSFYLLWVPLLGFYRVFFSTLPNCYELLPGVVSMLAGWLGFYRVLPDWSMTISYYCWSYSRSHLFARSCSWSWSAYGGDQGFKRQFRLSTSGRSLISWKGDPRGQWLQRERCHRTEDYRVLPSFGLWPLSLSVALSWVYFSIIFLGFFFTEFRRTIKADSCADTPGQSTAGAM